VITKVLAATINYDHPQAGMLHALRGIFGEQNVVNFDYMRLRNEFFVDEINDSFVDSCVRNKPDWIWLQVQDTEVISPAAIKEVRGLLPKTVISHWTGDVRSSVSTYLSSICKATHLTLVSGIGLIQRFREAGANQVEYLQIGLDWFEDVIGLPNWEPPFKVPQVVLIAGHYGDKFPGTKQREDAVRALMDEFVDVGIVGNGWDDSWPVVGTCEVKQQHHVWKRALVCLNVNNFNEIERYYSDRQLIAMASGTPVVCHYVPGLEKEFSLGEDCLSFTNPENLVKQVKFLLEDEGSRLRIGRAGRSEVIRSHTWFSRFLHILPKVEEIRQNLLGCANLTT
jgi:hypothetical protein